MKKLFLLLFIGVFSHIESVGQECSNCVETTNTGLNSTAIGTNTVSNGHSSLASGFASEATGDFSFASGRLSEAIGNYSFATGYKAQAIGDFSFSSGNETLAEGKYSFAAGNQTKAKGQISTAMGMGSEATATYAMAMGFYATATEPQSMAIGSTVKVSAGNSIVIGKGGPWNEDIYLENDIPRSLMIGFDSKNPTLFVSDSPNDPWYEKTGRVAIGNMTDPQAKLHIFSDEDENATLFLQPSNWGENDAEIWIGNQNHGVSANITEGTVYKTEINHVFKGGDIYIEDIDKGIIMKSPDGRCWRGTLDNSGLLNFEEMETCPEIITGASQNKFEQTENRLRVYPNPTSELITIEFENPARNQFEVSLLDEKGIVLKISKTTEGSTQLYTGDLQPGIYIVQAAGNGQKYATKIVRN